MGGSNRSAGLGLDAFAWEPRFGRQQEKMVRYFARFNAAPRPG